MQKIGEVYGFKENHTDSGQDRTGKKLNAGHFDAADKQMCIRDSIEPVLSSEIRFPSKTERGTRLAEKTAQAMQEIRNLQERKEPGWELLLKAELLKIWQGYYLSLIHI